MDKTKYLSFFIDTKKNKYFEITFIASVSADVQYRRETVEQI